MSAAARSSSSTDADGAATPSGPTVLHRSSWLGVLKRAVTQFRVDNVSDWAAALTYRAVMSLASGVLVVVAGLGLLGHSATQRLLDNVGQLTPGEVKGVISQIVENVQSPGALLAVVVWLLASALFAVYIANFGSYNKTYGSLAGVIIFLVWLWLTNVAVLLGAELNAELLHARATQANGDAATANFVEPRDTRKLDDDAQAHATALSTGPAQRRSS